MNIFFIAAVVFLIGVVAGEQKCQKDSHGVRRYNGKSCGSTTRFKDGHRGACGCGPRGTDTPYSWGLSDLIAAPSQGYFDDGGPNRWCGKKCGRCIKLTPTGGFIPGKGARPLNTNPKIFLVANDCPHSEYEWCGNTKKPGSNSPNSHGYEIHFDLQNHVDQVSNMGWNNPEVTWEEVTCPQHFKDKYSQCECQ